MWRACCALIFEERVVLIVVHFFECLNCRSGFPSHCLLRTSLIHRFYSLSVTGARLIPFSCAIDALFTSPLLFHIPFASPFAPHLHCKLGHLSFSHIPFMKYFIPHITHRGHTSSLLHSSFPDIAFVGTCHCHSFSTLSFPVTIDSSPWTFTTTD